jgi:hypothetical protein
MCGISMKKDVSQSNIFVSNDDVRVPSRRQLRCDENQSSNLQRLKEDEFNEDLFSGNLLFDLFELDENRFVRWWNSLVTAVAFLDFSVAIIQTFPSICIDQPHALKYISSSLLEFKQQIELLFSVLWFLDAFVAAHQVRIQNRRTKDKSRLLPKRTPEPEEAGHNYYKWRNSEVVYFTSVTIHLLLIPVGFYMYVLDLFYGAKIQAYFLLFLRQQQNNQLTKVKSSNDPFAHYTLFYVILSRVQSLGAALLHGRIQTSAKAFRLSVLRELIRRFLARPSRFYRRTRRFVRFVQWAHYGGPIVNKVKDFKLSVENLRIQYREERDARRAREVRERSRKDRNEKEICESAARVIQHAFRSHHVRIKTNALRALTGQREYFAARRLQRQFRASLKRARHRIKNNIDEFVLLQKEERMRRKQGDQLELSKRKRMYELQAELTQRFQTLVNKELLLMPNTQFAVSWKILMLLVVSCDVMGLIIRPLMHRYGYILLEMTLPSALDKWASALRIPPRRVCRLSQGSLSASQCSHDKSKKQKLFVLIEGATWMPKRSCHDPEVLPWYCGRRFLGAMIMSISEFLIRDFVSVLGIIRCLDIFVTFFTGELDQRTGLLQPKPFLKRWIIPGLLLQSLVNPSFAAATGCVHPILSWMRQQGPFRVLRWTVALFYPTALHFRALIIHLWRKLVRFENYK